MAEILEIYRSLFKILLSYWWIITPVALFFILKSLYTSYLFSEFIKSLKWMILEIKFPQEAVKSPKAMEQFFHGLHATQKTLKFKDKYIKGEMFSPYFSVELTGDSGEIHMYIRTLDKYRNLVESLVYSQYPEAEIFEADDYVLKMPAEIPSKDYDIWGTELLLTQPDAYPIRTYPVFFEEREIEERNDPIAGLFEFLSSLSQDEHVWMQILVNPTDDTWKKDGEKLVSKIMGREVKEDKKTGSLIIAETQNWASEFTKGVIDFIMGQTGEIKEEEKKVNDTMAYLSPGEKDVVLSVEKNIAKLGFKTIVRYMYWGHKDVFSKDKTASLGGFFKQFNTQNLNGFKPNKMITPGYGKVFKKRREPGQKRFFISWYKRRFFPFKKFEKRGFIFNTEELATIFHIPIKIVKGERIPRIEAKKGGPPASLPTV